jgi:small subunit ribosomal protein S16
LATKIRLKRTGARGNPHYRLVVMDSRKPRDGRTIEELGYYCPTTHPPTVKIDVQRALHWLSIGAQPTDTARSLLSKQGIMEMFRGNSDSVEQTSDAPVTPEAEAASEPAQAATEPSAV